MYLSKILWWFQHYKCRLSVAILLSFVPHWYFESLVIAHALKSPLSSLSLALHEANGSLRSPVKLKAALTQAEASRIKLQTMLFAESRDTLTTFSLVEQLQRVQTWFAASGHNVQVLLKHGKLDQVVLSGSSLLFQQLLEILVDNGIHSSEVQALVVIAVSLEQKEVRIVVHDFGTGFVCTTMKNEASDGTRLERWGVGLTCAHHIARLFRGKLQIQSTEAVGTQVICTMPYCLG